MSTASSPDPGGHRHTPSRYEQFHDFRTRLNERILAAEGPRPGSASTLNTRRFFTLDSACYRPGALDAPTKELLGLVASMVLRCDDCIAYHIDMCVRSGVTDQQLWEAFDIALIVGGSIVIPHLRRAVDFLDECRRRAAAPA
jgi:AhpD family alkylhydroperoxidase